MYSAVIVPLLLYVSPQCQNYVHVLTYPAQHPTLAESTLAPLARLFALFHLVYYAPDQAHRQLLAQCASAGNRASPLRPLVHHLSYGQMALPLARSALSLVLSLRFSHLPLVFAGYGQVGGSVALFVLLRRNWIGVV